jgi:putative FmdB family regulatory protein
MPVYQYACRQCAHRFDRLVTGQARPTCPACASEDLERLLSLFAVGRGGGGPTPESAGGGCGRCGDPRGPGACSMD